MSLHQIPVGWVELEDGSYAPPSALRKGIVSVKAKVSCDNEAKLHQEILDFCRSKGWPVVHSRMDRPATAVVGTPDFVVAMPGGKTIWVEAKTAKGKLRPEQQAWLAALRAKGHMAGVVRHMQEFIIMTEVV